MSRDIIVVLPTPVANLKARRFRPGLKFLLAWPKSERVRLLSADFDVSSVSRMAAS